MTMKCRFALHAPVPEGLSTKAHGRSAVPILITRHARIYVICRYALIGSSGVRLIDGRRTGRAT
jgi:hypothetical protein